MGLMIPDVAAKAGVEGLTCQLAYDWGRAGIRVNAIAPTVTLTGDRIQGLWEAKSEEEKKKVFSAIPLGRLSWGTLHPMTTCFPLLSPPTDAPLAL